MRTSCRAARLSAVSFASFVAAVLIVSVQVRGDVYWTLPAGQSGDWSVASNWGGTIPTSSDFAYIVNGGTVAVTQLGETCGRLSLGSSANSGTVLMTTGGLSTTSQEYIGNAGTGTFAQSGGTNSLSGYLSLSNVSGSGAYYLSGSGLLAAQEEFIGPGSGTGSFTQSGGTNSVSYMNLGGNSGSSGTYNLSGNGLLSASTEEIGDAGTGNFTQSGGSNSVSTELILGYLSGGKGTYNLSGSGQLSAPYEYIGGLHGDIGSFIQSGGTNTISGSLILAQGASNPGSYNLNGGLLLLSTSGLTSDSAAMFNFGGGTLGAAAPWSSAQNMNMSGIGGSGTVDTTSGNIGLAGNLTGSGGLTKSGEGLLILSGTNSYSGGTTVTAGTLTVSSKNALPAGTSLTVGDWGPLSFNGTGSWTAAVSGSWSAPGKWTRGVPNTVGAAAVLSVPISAAVTITLDEPVTLGILVLGNSASTTVGYTLNGSGTHTLTFDNSGNGATIAITNGSHVIDAPVVLADNLVVSASGKLTFGSASSITDNGGGCSLTMRGADGTLIMSGSDNYAGGTFVSAGTLILASNTALADGTNLTVGMGASSVFDTSAAASLTASSPAVSPVREPGTLVFLGIGALGLLGYAKRRPLGSSMRAASLVDTSRPSLSPWCEAVRSCSILLLRRTERPFSSNVPWENRKFPP
ncbi:MAG: autotransporter-associated beta strand repeat-containing protein [Thermoguttaceae bacterium]